MTGPSLPPDDDPPPAPALVFFTSEPPPPLPPRAREEAGLGGKFERHLRTSPPSERGCHGGGGGRWAPLRHPELFAKDLEMFARHAKRSTVNLEDVKLLARRSKSLLKYITEKSEEIALNSLEEKEKRKKKSGSRKGRRASDEQEEHVVAESDDSNMA
ncbi:centromere protein S isoform X2 [Podarcis raffonei]|uniref:centromere protein S isoform X2 n=1 Tax=Podarcis raffonei TaxID=65483 RepID=UPI0023290FB7|nr:centromere protein S isoform X2 [Podarcis raffonei]